MPLRNLYRYVTSDRRDSLTKKWVYRIDVNGVVEEFVDNDWRKARAAAYQRIVELLQQQGYDVVESNTSIANSVISGGLHRGISPNPDSGRLYHINIARGHA